MSVINDLEIENRFIKHYRLNNFERSRRFSQNQYSLSPVTNVLSGLGNPQLRFNAIHVAGTVGKGSTCVYLSRLLRVNYEHVFGKTNTRHEQKIGTGAGEVDTDEADAGKEKNDIESKTKPARIGLYTSPHYESLFERIQINETPITPAAFNEIWNRVLEYDEEGALSFFDALTAIAFLYFRKENVDWAVIETGLGGRLDSTNLVKPQCCVITRIGLDHRNILGDTIEEIAFEKAGIIKPETPVYSMPQKKAAQIVIQNAAKKLNAPVAFFAQNGEPAEFYKKNLDFCLWVFTQLFEHNVEKLAPTIERRTNAAGPGNIPPEYIKAVPYSINENINLYIKGRLEVLCKSPLIVFDSAHNADAAQELYSWAVKQEGQWNILFNTMPERDPNLMLEPFCKNHDKFRNIYLLTPEAFKEPYQEPSKEANSEPLKQGEVFTDKSAEISGKKTGEESQKTILYSDLEWVDNHCGNTGRMQMLTQKNPLLQMWKNPSAGQYLIFGSVYLYKPVKNFIHKYIIE